MIFLTVSHPRPVTTAKSVTVIIPHRLSTKAWSREVYQTYGGAKGGKPRSSGRTPDTRTGAPPSPATRASSRWAPSATPGTVCPCASPGRCGIADIPATPVVPPTRTGYILLRILSAHSRNPSVHQTHDRANFDSSMELKSYVQAGTSRMNRFLGLGRKSGQVWVPRFGGTQPEFGLYGRGLFPSRATQQFTDSFGTNTHESGNLTV